MPHVATLGFHHIALQATDVERVAGFYRSVLGLSELARHHHPDGALRSIWLQVNSTTPGPEGGFIAVEAWEGERGGALGFSMVALRIEPTARAQLEAQLAEAGVAIVRRSKWTVYFHDPEGNLVGLSHHPHDAPTV